jgi:hypothetical protein
VVAALVARGGKAAVTFYRRARSSAGLSPTGRQGLITLELMTAARNDPRVAATNRRNQELQTLGNFTILRSRPAWDAIDAEIRALQGRAKQPRNSSGSDPSPAA